MEPIKLFEDTEAFAAWQEYRTELNILISQLAEKFQGSSLKFDAEVFIQFINKGTEFVYKLLEDQALTDIKKLNINSDTIKENLLSGIGKKALKYDDIHSKIKAGLNLCKINADYIPFKNEKPIVSDEETEKKRKEYTFYIENEDQKQLWELQNKLSTAINRMEVFLKKKELKSIFHQGAPENIALYVNFTKDSKVKITPSEERFGRSQPTSGGMICEPDYHWLKKLV